MAKEQTTITISEITEPSDPDDLSFRDKMSDEKYRAWLQDLLDSSLEDEQYRVSQELIEVGSCILANAGASAFTAPVTGGLSLAVHGSSMAVKQGKRIYYQNHLRLCDEELKRRGLGARRLSDSETFKSVGRGVLRTVIPKALFS